MDRARKFIFAVMAVSLPALAADTLDVKPGLWEMSITTTTSGMALPADVLQKMEPEQRAMLEQQMKQMAAAAPQTFNEKSCMSAEDIAKGAFRGEQEREGQSCAYTPVTATARSQAFDVSCSGMVEMKGNMRLEAPDREHVRGEVSMKSPQMSVNVKITGHWVSASCAGADKD